MTEQLIEKTNYEIFLDTIKTLSTSQGFYSRLANGFNALSTEDKEKVKVVLNAKPKWKTTLDCVLFLEQ